MTQDEIRKLLGGYATNALSADERRILFEAALDDQELFNALQDEETLRELLSDPVSREQVRKALEAPKKAPHRASFWSRRWLFGVAIPAVLAVIVIAIMNRPQAPVATAPPVQIAEAPKAPPPIEPAQPQLKANPPAVQAKKQSKAIRQEPPVQIAEAPNPLPSPQPEFAPAAPARMQVEASARNGLPTGANGFLVAAQAQLPRAIEQQFASGFAASAPRYQGPLVRYSVLRSGPAGQGVRVEVTAGVPGYLALYEVEASGNSKRIYPANAVAATVSPNVTVQIPSNPVKVDAGARLRLVVVPAPFQGVIGQLGGVVAGAAMKATPPPAPLVVDIPLGPN